MLICPYLDVKIMINIYYTFFYTLFTLWYSIESWGHAADCRLNKILILQKTAFRVILKVPPRGNVWSVGMLFINIVFYCFTWKTLGTVISNFSLTNLLESHVWNLLRHGPTTLWSLLTTGVNTFNSYLLAEGHMGLQGRPTKALTAKTCDK